MTASKYLVNTSKNKQQDHHV